MKDEWGSRLEPRVCFFCLKNVFYSTNNHLQPPRHEKGPRNGRQQQQQQQQLEQEARDASRLGPQVCFFLKIIILLIYVLSIGIFSALDSHHVTKKAREADVSRAIGNVFYLIYVFNIRYILNITFRGLNDSVI